MVGKRTKHIDIKYKFINDQVEQKVVKLVKIDTKKNLADLFTKALSKDRFRELSSKFLNRVSQPHASKEAARLANSTSLLNPQPMTADQDGPPRSSASNRPKCAAIAASAGRQCRSYALTGYTLCRTHLNQELGETCIGLTSSNSRCQSSADEKSLYCKRHAFQGKEGAISSSRKTRRSPHPVAAATVAAFLQPATPIMHSPQPQFHPPFSHLRPHPHLFNAFDALVD